MNNNLAPWRSILSRALHRNRSLANARYFQLATINIKGEPANRTVVFRGFLEETNQLQIITDSRSEKIKEINHNSASEICWYFPKTREQFRISGNLTMVDKNSVEQSIRVQVWQQLSDAARQQFTWPEPGQPITENQEKLFLPTPSENEPVFHFILLLFTPKKVDHLELRGQPHQRTIYYLDNSQTWMIQSVNP
ncbi:MAG: Npun_F5749 family FMN-dependent PPOX-type flavoprotein [Crocosphaera sp.]